MTTCRSCGSQTAADDTCVVCGADLTETGQASTDATGASQDRLPPEDDVSPEDRASPDGGPVAVLATRPSASGTDAGEDASTPGPVGDGATASGAAAAEEPAEPGPGGRAPGDVPPDGSRPDASWQGGHAPVPAWPASTPPPDAPVLAVTENARNWGMIAHLSALVAAGIGGLSFLGPLVVWLIKRDEDRFVAHHSVEALNFNLSITLYVALSFVLALTIIGLVVAIPVVVVSFVLWFVASIVAAVKAQRGEAYRYPLTIRLVKE